MQFSSSELYLLLNMRPADRSLWLVGVNLTRADLRWADLEGAILHAADLRGADLTGATLYKADLSKANLTGARVTAEQLAQAASLKGAILPDGTRHVAGLGDEPVPPEAPPGPESVAAGERGDEPAAVAAPPS